VIYKNKLETKMPGPEQEEQKAKPKTEAETLLEFQAGQEDAEQKRGVAQAKVGFGTAEDLVDGAGKVVGDGWDSIKEGSPLALLTFFVIKLWTSVYDTFEKIAGKVAEYMTESKKSDEKIKELNEGLLKDKEERSKQKKKENPEKKEDPQKNSKDNLTPPIVDPDVGGGASKKNDKDPEIGNLSSPRQTPNNPNRSGMVRGE
jgi:hypothetical protein